MIESKWITTKVTRRRHKAFATGKRTARRSRYRLVSVRWTGDDVPTLTDLRAKYGFDGGKYEPKPDCKFCKGTGEKMVKTTPPRMTFCICLFVDHELSEFAGESLAATAKKMREDMERAR